MEEIANALHQPLRWRRLQYNLTRGKLHWTGNNGCMFFDNRRFVVVANILHRALRRGSLDNLTWRGLRNLKR
jgi:hypothetical protein